MDVANKALVLFTSGYLDPLDTPRYLGLYLRLLTLGISGFTNPFPKSG